MRSPRETERGKGGLAGSAAGGVRAGFFLRKGANRGFTLVEVMIALFVLVTALLGLVSTTVVVVKANSFSKTMSTATTLAKDKLEALKNSSYTALASGTDYATASSAVQSSSSSSAMYTRTWTVSADGTPSAGLKTIQVSVVWSWQNANHTVTLQTIIAR